MQLRRVFNRPINIAQHPHTLLLETNVAAVTPFWENRQEQQKICTYLYADEYVAARD